MNQVTKPILLVEDELLIAMDIEETLSAAELGKVVHASTCAEAEAWLASNTPAAGILDIKLRDGECAAIANTLDERGVPFLVHSGSSKNKGDFDDVFLRGHWIAKPFLAEELVSTVRQLLRIDSGNEI